MKHNFTLLACFALFFSMAAKAQPVISTNDLPIVGTSTLVNIDNSVGSNVSLGQSSTSPQTWDFTGLAGILDTVTFFDPATHPAAADFSGTTIARQASLESLLGVSLDVLGLPIELPEATAFYSVDAEGKVLNNGVNIYINVLGFDLGSQSLQAVPADLYLAPIQLGQSNSSNAHLEKELEITAGVVATISIDLDRTATADAYGTVNLPCGLSYQALRVKENLIASVSAQLGILGGIDTTLAIDIYRFMAPNQRYPIATVSASEQEIGTIINFIEYKTSDPCVVGIEDMPILANAELVLPTNLITNQNSQWLPVVLHYEGNIAGHKLEIYNLQGQRLLQQQQLSELNQLEISTLPAGSYFVVWSNESGQTIARSRFAVIK